jgi:hypothetical protein
MLIFRTEFALQAFLQTDSKRRSFAARRDRNRQIPFAQNRWGNEVTARRIVHHVDQLSIRRGFLPDLVVVSA